MKGRSPAKATSTSTASPPRSAASASSVDHTPRSRAKWLNVPAGITSSGTPASSATDEAALMAPSPPATPRICASAAARRSWQARSWPAFTSMIVACGSSARSRLVSPGDAVPADVLTIRARPLPSGAMGAACGA
jgi:hypothetical protein